MEELFIRRNTYGDDVPIELSTAIQQTRGEIESARTQIALLSGEQTNL